MPTTEEIKALKKSLQTKPHDTAIYGALFDALQDLGSDQYQAKDEADLARNFGLVCLSLRGENKRSAKLRASIRRYVHIAAQQVPIKLLGGNDMRDDPPAVEGEGPYYTFRSSNARVRYPGAAKRAGHKLDYHCDTRVIAVGWRWIFTNMRDSL